MSRLEWKRALTFFSLVLGADQVTKYLWADMTPSVGMERMRAGLFAVVAGAILLVVVVAVTRAGWISPLVAGMSLGAGVSLVIDWIVMGAARPVLDLGFGINDLAAFALSAGVVGWLIGALRVREDVSPFAVGHHSTMVR